MALNQQQELFFEQLGRCTTSASEANQKQSSLLKSPTKSEKQGKGFDGKKSGKDEGDDDDAVSVIKLFSKQKFLILKTCI